MLSLVIGDDTFSGPYEFFVNSTHMNSKAANLLVNPSSSVTIYLLVSSHQTKARLAMVE